MRFLHDKMYTKSSEEFRKVMVTIARLSDLYVNKRENQYRNVFQRDVRGRKGK